jgi:hypothetical protein
VHRHFTLIAKLSPPSCVSGDRPPPQFQSQGILFPDSERRAVSGPSRSRTPRWVLARRELIGAKRAWMNLLQRVIGCDESNIKPEILILARDAVFHR